MYIDKTKYYLLASVNGLVKIISFNIDDKNIHTFHDISAIDILTMNYSKEELLKYASIAEKDYPKTKIFILRMKGNDYPKYYDCIYKSNNNLLMDFACERLNRINYNNNRAKGIRKISININKTIDFKKKMYLILDSVCREQKILKKILFSYNNNYIKEPLLSPYLLELLKSVDDDYLLKTYYGLAPQFETELKSYKRIRGLYLEGLYVMGKRERFSSYRLNDLSYPSEIFGYNEPFLITPYNAKQDKDNTYFSYYVKQSIPMQKDLEFAHQIDEIMHSPFENKEMGRLYKIGGTAKVLEQMDGNDIYNSSLKDLLRAGIINETYYLEMTSQKFYSKNKNI